MGHGPARSVRTHAANETAVNMLNGKAFVPEGAVIGRALIV